MRLIVRVSMALVAVFAFALSFQSLMTLGQLAQYGQLAWMYPLTVDLGAVSSCAAWLATRSRQALGMTWAQLAISVLQNGTVHWLIATGQRPTWWLVTLVGVVPPLTLGLTVHLAVGLGRIRREVRNDIPRNPVGHGGGEISDHDPELEQARRVIAAHDGTVGRGRLAELMGISEYRARTLLEQLSGSNGHGGGR